MTTTTRADQRVTGKVEVRGLTKRFGDFTAVDDLDLDVHPGRVTGFLGPNGSGKTTTLRMLLGLVRPTSGTATIDGRRYADIPMPLRVVGSALEATNFHPGRSGRDHLRVLAAAGGIGNERVDELLELVGIPAAARKRAGGYSMGMRQRLGLAAALLGDPQVILLDEPANGLDPEGIRWLRGFLRGLAAEGRTVLISSHLLNEVEQTVDDVVIIANGRQIAQGTVDGLRGQPTSFVRCADPDRLASALRQRGLEPSPATGGLSVRSEDMALIGETAHAAGVAVHELRSERSHLEDLYFRITQSAGDRNRSGAGATDAVVPGPGRSSHVPPDLPADLPPPTGAPVQPSEGGPR